MIISPTTSPAEATRRIWDVVVVGAGPAGAMAAREMGRRGCAVLLVDRASFPRWKVCGCCLNGHALATLKTVGLGDLTARCGATPLKAIRWAVAGRVAQVQLFGGVALSRETFDAALVTAAIEVGAAFLPRTQATLVGQASRPFQPSPGVLPVPLNLRLVDLHQGGSIEQVAARVVIAADGLGGHLAARAGVRAVAAMPGARIGVGVVVSNGSECYSPGVIHMACGRHGYLGLVRLEDGRLDLAAAFDPAKVRSRGGPGAVAVEMLAEVGWPAVPDLAEQGWRGTPALTRRPRRFATERLFLVGDAAGYIEPFTGEGMSWALAAGRDVAPLAERAIRGWHSALASEWSAVYRRSIGRRQIVCRAIAALLRSPGLTRTTIHLLSRAPALAAPVAHYLNRGS